jgi:sortase A
MRRAVAWLCAIVGTVLLSQAGWIHAKAALAQMLITRAWQRTLAGASDAKPWPWADTRPVAQLIFPGERPRVLTVLGGASGRNLAFGPVHDSSSVLPGESGNAVIAGHRDTHFRALRELVAGDHVLLGSTDGRSRAFVVVDRRVVDSRVTRIALDADEPRLTLVTCYPFDSIDPGGPLRFVITADLVPGK